MIVVDPETNVTYKLFFEYLPGDQDYFTDSKRMLRVNGVTYAVLTEVADDEDKFWSVALCSQYDRFSKAAGRTVALRKLGAQLPREFRKALWDAVRESGMKLESVSQR